MAADLGLTSFLGDERTTGAGGFEGVNVPRDAYEEGLAGDVGVLEPLGDSDFVLRVEVKVNGVVANVLNLGAVGGSIESAYLDTGAVGTVI